MIGPLKDLINVLFPAECHVCGVKLAPHERFACTLCLTKMPRSGYHRRKLNPMEERFAGQFPFYKATGHFFYNKDSILASLIQDMKYRNFPDIGTMLGNIAGKELFSTDFFDKTEVIVPVPMHFMKQAKRGYNQTHYIARGLSEATGFPVCNAMKMDHPHSTQTALSREERLANTERLFSVRKPELLDGKGVLLIDDVCTTGATLGAAASTLLAESHPASVTLFTLGVTF